MSDDSMVNRRGFLGAAAFGMATSLASSPFAGSALAGERWLGALGLTRDVNTPPLGDEGPFPDLGGAVGWINSAPLSGKSLRGKVVLADIWTYSCINSIRPMPYLKSWAAKYKAAGVIIGVHSPEFEFEKDRANVEKAVRDMNITYPVAIDSNHGVWRAFSNQYWPADYFIDGAAAKSASPASINSFGRRGRSPNGHSRSNFSIPARKGTSLHSVDAPPRERLGDADLGTHRRRPRELAARTL